MRLSRALKGLLAAGAAFVVALVTFLVANRVDESLDPVAAAYYESGRAPPLTPKSGFAWVIGVGAPVDQEPVAFAMAWSQAMESAGNGDGRFPEVRDALQAKGAPELFCRPEIADCVALYAANPRAVDDLAADNALLLERYAHLQAQVDLADAGVWSSIRAPGPNYSAVLSAQSILLSGIAARAARGDTRGALAALELDAALYRRWLPQARVLVSKMVVVRALSRDLLLAVQLSRHARDPSEADRATLRRLVAPLSVEEQSTRAAMRFEAALLPDALDRMLATDRNSRRRFLGLQYGPKEDLAFLFTLRNATLNFHYPAMAGWELVDAAPSHEVAARAAELRLRWQEGRRSAWRWLHNPGGKLLAAEWFPDFEPYILRVRDLDGLARLACTVVDVRLAGVPASQVAGHLEKSVPECRDPYERRPMTWDAEAGTLSFAPRSPGSDARFGGRKGRVALSPF